MAGIAAWRGTGPARLSGVLSKGPAKEQALLSSSFRSMSCDVNSAGGMSAELIHRDQSNAMRSGGDGHASADLVVPHFRVSLAINPSFDSYNSSGRVARTFHSEGERHRRICCRRAELGVQAARSGRCAGYGCIVIDFKQDIAGLFRDDEIVPAIQVHVTRQHHHAGIRRSKLMGRAEYPVTIAENVLQVPVKMALVETYNIGD